MDRALNVNGGFAMTFATSSPGASTAGQGTTPVSLLNMPSSPVNAFPPMPCEALVTCLSSRSVKTVRPQPLLYGEETKQDLCYAMLVGFFSNSIADHGPLA